MTEPTTLICLLRMANIEATFPSAQKEIDVSFRSRMANKIVPAKTSTPAEDHAHIIFVDPLPSGRLS